MSNKTLPELLLDIKAVTITSDLNNLFTWASGIKSPIYCDNRLTISYPEIRDAIATEFAELIKNKFPDVQIIAGTATAGIPHAAWVSQKLNLPMVYVRSSSKDHGKAKQIEGVLAKNSKVVLIEDLVSTGGSSIKAVSSLRINSLSSSDRSPKMEREYLENKAPLITSGRLRSAKTLLVVCVTYRFKILSWLSVNSS